MTKTDKALAAIKEAAKEATATLDNNDYGSVLEKLQYWVHDELDKICYGSEYEPCAEDVDY